jgi:hypothetical protein
MTGRPAVSSATSHYVSCRLTRTKLASVFSIRVIILFLVSLTAARAADIEVRHLDGTALIFVEGKFELSDIDRFQTKIAGVTPGKATVVFESKGGRLISGIRIGALIRAKKFNTLVPDGAECASACALAWLGGTRRLVGKDSLIGFHAAYVVKDAGPMESAPGNAILGAYLNQLGLSEKAILYITQAAPTSIQWMSLEEAAEHGITVSLLPSPHSAPKSQPNGAAVTEQAEGSLERRAIDFVHSLVKRWSGPNSELLPFLDHVYADHVLYNGKSTPRQAVLLSKRHLADRWTQRTYTIRPGSLSANCAGPGGTCRVKGIMSWKFENPKTKGSARGVANFEYSVINEGKALQITAETSSGGDKQPEQSNPLAKAGRNIQQLFGELSKLRPTSSTPAQTAVRPKAPTAR